MKQININEPTKQTFDTIQVELSTLKGRIISQDETLNELILIYNTSKIKIAEDLKVQ